MKTRTNQALLCRFTEQDESEIEVTYAPVERVLVFRTIKGGILPIQLKLNQAWELVRKDWIVAMAESEQQTTERIDPRQIEIPEVVEAFIQEQTKSFSARMRHAILSKASAPQWKIADMQPVQGPEVGDPEPAPVCVQESSQPGEATGAPVQPDI